MKEIFLDKMLQERIITKDMRDKMDKYCIVAAEKPFFGRIWGKLFKDDENATLITVVKVLE